MNESPIDRLEARLRTLEDTIEIYQLVAAYGPRVDSLSEDALRTLWTDDAVYDAGGLEPMVGQDTVAALVHLPTHQDYVARGCAHVMSLPTVTVHGDTATAVGYSQVFVGTGDSFEVARSSANVWDLVRTGVGWRVRHRTNRPLDGAAAARDLLRPS